MDKLTKAEQYAEDVRAKRILTCELVQLAVKRYYNDLRDALDKGWYFDRKAAMRAIGFIERLKHTKGEWAGQRFRAGALAALHPLEHLRLEECRWHEAFPVCVRGDRP
jgi:phage terminase large subunit-like protein